MTESSASADKRGLNIELNLVPFIDLLSTLVLFLLVTAVWLQVSTIPASVKSSEGTSAASATSPRSLKIHLSTEGVEILWPSESGNLSDTLPKENGNYPWKELLRVISEQKTSFDSALLSSADDIPYGTVIQAIDTLRSAGTKGVSLRTE